MAIILYSYPYCPYSHRCRFVFGEKEMEAELREVNINEKPEELALYNPYNQVPVLVDRELYLYESNIIAEYLDDRFPHPQLMPPDIVLRARLRLLLFKLDAEVFPSLRFLILKPRMKQEQADICRQRIREGIIQLFDMMPKSTRFIIDRDFTMLDIVLAPMLWRLDYYGIQLPSRVRTAVYKYADRIFERPSFIKSLSVAERAMRE